MIAEAPGSLLRWRDALDRVEAQAARRGAAGCVDAEALAELRAAWRAAMLDAVAALRGAVSD